MKLFEYTVFECHGWEMWEIKAIQSHHRIKAAQLYSLSFWRYSWLIVDGMMMGFAGLAHIDR